MELPPELLRYLPDAEVSIDTWNAERDDIRLLIVKDIGPEEGILTLGAVSWLYLRPRFTIGAAAVYDRPCPDFPQISLDPDEYLFVFEDAWEGAHAVVATSVEYQIVRREPA